jgi:hypothetical protein
MTRNENAGNHGDAHRHTRRVVLGAAAALGMLAPAAPAALAAAAQEGRPRQRPDAADAAGRGSDVPVPAAEGDGDGSPELWGTSASGRGAGVRGSGRFGVVGEGTHSGVTGDGFVGVQGTSSIVDGGERGVGVWARAVAPGSTALRADGPSEFNGVARFARSGVATVRRGSASAVVSGVPMTAATVILATLQSRVDGTYLHAVETDVAGESFTIYLTAAPSRDVRLGWFAVG